MSATPSLRYAQAGEGSLLNRLKLLARSLELASTPLSAETMDALNNAIGDRQNNIVYVAMVGSTPVGYIWATTMGATANPSKPNERSVLLKDLYVRKDCQGSGAGSLLRNTVLDAYRGQGVSVQAEAPNTEAHRFWAKERRGRGFAPRSYTGNWVRSRTPSPAAR